MKLIDFLMLNQAFVLVCLGCYNKIPQTKWLINNKHLFLTVLEVGSPRSQHQSGQALVKALSGLQTAAFLYTHRAEGAGEFPGAIFIMAIIPFMRTLLHDLNHLPTPSYWALVSTYEIGGHTNIQTIIPFIPWIKFYLTIMNYVLNMALDSVC